MIILSVESSCDETAVALVEDGRHLLTDQIFSQVDLHKIYGGVVPEIASRSHTEVISILAERVMALVTEEMTNAAQLKVPLVADAHMGKSWYEAK